MTETSTPGPTTSESRTVAQYVEFWNAATGDEQQQLAAATFVDGVGYHAPVGLLRGAEELIDFRNRFAQHMPDYEFRARTEPEVRQDHARLRWELIVSGESFATGTDVLELADDGRIASVTGFLDRAPDGFDPRVDH